MHRLQASLRQAKAPIEPIALCSHTCTSQPVLLLLARRFPLVVLPKALRGTSGVCDGLAAELGAHGLAVQQLQAKVLTQKALPPRNMHTKLRQLFACLQRVSPPLIACSSSCCCLRPQMLRSPRLWRRAL